MPENCTKAVFRRIDTLFSIQTETHESAVPGRLYFQYDGLGSLVRGCVLLFLLYEVFSV